MELAAALDRTLRTAGIPIVGVSIGRLTDRATWRVQYDPTATAQHQIDGDALTASFDVTAQGVIDADIAARAATSSADKDRLADIALMVRFKDVPAWNALTLAQKKAAVQAQQVAWQGIRDFIDKNF